jgi:hypothetical protein
MLKIQQQMLFYEIFIQKLQYFNYFCLVIFRKNQENNRTPNCPDCLLNFKLKTEYFKKVNTKLPLSGVRGHIYSWQTS